jgi:hypothetical protein
LPLVYVSSLSSEFIPLPKKSKRIPAIPFDVLVTAHEAVIEDREKIGPGDTTISLVRSLHKDHKPEVIIATDYRLRAVAKLIGEGEGRGWTFAIGEDGSHIVNEALFRAAARAPLFEAKTVGQVSFDRDEFMKIALEESETDGQA